MPSKTPTDLNRWKGKLRKVYSQQVDPLIRTQQMNRQLTAVMKPHAATLRVPAAPLLQWLRQGHVTQTSLAIRRSIDENAASDSLINLIKELEKHRSEFTRKWFISRYPLWMQKDGYADRDFDRIAGKRSHFVPRHVFAGDCSKLRAVCRVTKKFVNKFVAHSASALDQKKVRVTFRHIDRAEKEIERIYRRYGTLILGALPSPLVAWDATLVKPDLEKIWPHP